MMDPDRILKTIASNEKTKRKEKGLSQAELARESGVSLGSLRRFEQTGDISLCSLLKLAIVLEATDSMLSLFSGTREFRTIKELLDAKYRKS